jgi:transposase
VNRRFELTNAGWARISPPLPSMRPRRGDRWPDHRQVINRPLSVVRTGAPQPDVADRYGLQETLYKRFVRWRVGGTWARMQACLHTKADATGEPGWDVQLGATVVQAHKHAAGARKGGLAAGDTARRQAVGRSRGRLTTSGCVSGLTSPWRSKTHPQ